MSWWVGQPFDPSCQDEAGNPLPGDPPCTGEFLSRLVDQPFFADGWPALLHVGDCPIVPLATYQVQASADGVAFTAALELQTITQPDKWWADIVGEKVGEEWSAPNQIVNFVDIQAAIQKFENSLGPPHFTWVDIDGQVPNAVTNFADIQMIVLAFEGAFYPYSSPQECP